MLRRLEPPRDATRFEDHPIPARPPGYHDPPSAVLTWRSRPLQRTAEGAEAGAADARARPVDPPRPAPPSPPAPRAPGRGGPAGGSKGGDDGSVAGPSPRLSGSRPGVHVTATLAADWSAGERRKRLATPGDPSRLQEVVTWQPGICAEDVVLRPWARLPQSLQRSRKWRKKQ